jgi:hypothetical protein
MKSATKNAFSPRISGTELIGAGAHHNGLRRGLNGVSAPPKHAFRSTTRASSLEGTCGAADWIGSYQS